MVDGLTAEGLAQRSGTSVERIEQLLALGILAPTDGAFGPPDVMRARVVLQLEAQGIPTDALATALASGHLSLGYLQAAGRRHPRSELTFARLSDETGVAYATIERIYLAFGLPVPAADERVREEDLEAIKGLTVLLDAGIGEGDVLRLARVWGSGARRVAEYLPHYFHTAVEERFRARGMGDNQAYEAAIREVGLRVGRSGESLLGWLFRRHSEVFATEHQYQHVETALEEAGVRQRATRTPEAVAFVDLSGYTRLTEESGDAAAARASLALADLLGEVTSRHRGSTVKLLGDGALLHFPDPADAVRASLEIVATAPGRGLPQAHVGVNAGPMLYDEGDYFGRTVNLAARIAAAAEADQVLVGESLHGTVKQEGFRLREAGERTLKGFASPVRVFEAVRDQ